jgi:translation initiation factor 1A
MPKNLKGGSRHKKQAKKHNIVKSKSKLRIAKEEGEIYARVLSLYGNGMAEVICNDGIKRLLIIRRRFKGRNRRDNDVAIDKMLLVGLREWEVISEKKKEKVDLLYVYSNDDIDDMKNDSKLNYDILPDSLKVAISGDTGFDITNKRDWNEEYEKEQKEKLNKNIVNAEPDFDFDDI